MTSANRELYWPILCLLGGLLLTMVEVFVPSGGVLGLLSVGLLAYGIWGAFQVSTLAGAIASGAVMLLVPCVVALAFYIWPKTPMGRWIFLKPPRREDVQPDSRSARLEHLIGSFGRALTPLRPSGLVDFEGRKLDGLAEEGLIESGSLVQAVRIRGGEIVVRVAHLSGLDDDPEGETPSRSTV